MALSWSDRNIIGWLKPGKAVKATCAFDSSYAFGGESITPDNFGLGRIDRLIANPKDGIFFEPVADGVTNYKLKAFMNAPAVVFEETVTVTANVGTLKYPHAAIMYVSSGNTPYKAIPGGLTPVAGSVSVSEPVWGSRGTLTFLAADSVTSCKVTYATQAWKELFDNRVQCVITAGARVSGHASAAFTAGTPDVIGLGESACFIESIMWNDNGTYKPMKALYKAETAATTEATIDYTNSGQTTISVLQTDTLDAATDTVYINYIRLPASGWLYDRFVEEDDLTPSSDVVTVSSGLAVGSNMLLFGACGSLAGPTTKYATLISSVGSVGTTATLAQPTTVMNTANTLTFGSDHADTDHVKLTYICGQPHEIATVLLEVPSGTDLSMVTGVQLTAIGS